MFRELIKKLSKEAVEVVRLKRGAWETSLNSELKKRLRRNFNCPTVKKDPCPGQDKEGDIAVSLGKENILIECKRRYEGRKYAYHEFFVNICCFKESENYDRLVLLMWNELESVPTEDHKPLFSCFYTENRDIEEINSPDELTDEVENAGLVVIVVDVQEDYKLRILY